MQECDNSSVTGFKLYTRTRVCSRLGSSCFELMSSLERLFGRLLRTNTVPSSTTTSVTRSSSEEAGSLWTTWRVALPLTNSMVLLRCREVIHPTGVAAWMLAVSIRARDGSSKRKSESSSSSPPPTLVSQGQQPREASNTSSTIACSSHPH